jgi:putative CocE/NonD family hydrolase
MRRHVNQAHRPGGSVIGFRFLGTTRFVRLLLVVAAVLLTSCVTTPWKPALAMLGFPEPLNQIAVTRDVSVPMRDGVRLAADLYRPKAIGRYPVILISTPYYRRNPLYGYEVFGGVFASQGYAVVIQDVRGKYQSEGEFYPVVNEGPDGIDTLRWIADQPWCDGNVGMFGISYYGSTEWLAAPGAPASLKTIVPVFTTQNGYRIWLKGGVFNYNLTMLWHYEYDVRDRRGMSLVDWNRAIWALPLSSADDSIISPNPIYDQWIAHPLPDAFWDPMRVDRRTSEIGCSAFLIAGWFDPFVDAMLEDYTRMRTAGGSKAARGTQLMVGPWTHTTDSTFRYTDFGVQGSFLGQFKTVLRWYDFWLKGTPNGVDDDPPIRIFVMGENRWRTEREWPLARTRYTDLYLHSGGGANTAEGDGVLTLDPPELEPADTYLYDPADPAPSREQTAAIGDVSYQPADQGEVESRGDVLVYTTPVLDRDVEVTGPVRLVLFAESSAPDTDFTARLTDVQPDGRSLHVTSGIVRARFRESLEEPSLLREGSVYRYEIALGATSNLFRQGHRIRLQISSSDFPRHDRNLNTGQVIGASAETAAARQLIRHDRERPSHLILPVIPTYSP